MRIKTSNSFCDALRKDAFRKNLRSLFAILVFAYLPGCTTPPQDVFRQYSTYDSKSSGVVTGARSRVISTITPGVGTQPNRIEPQRVTCVEPSPDVATAVANSFGVGVSVLGGGSGSLSGGAVEGLVQLGERTIAVQALLKQGYQACLDYANGAITATTYSLRSAKLDDLLVTMVLAEIAGGEFGRQGASIGGGKASANAAASVMGTGIPEIDAKSSKEDLKKAELAVIKAQKDLDAAKTTLDSLKPDQTDERAAAQKVVDDKQSLLTVALAERNVALRKLMQSADTNSSASASMGVANGTGGLSNFPSAETAAILEKMQRNFVEKDIDNVYISTCMAELGFSQSNWKPNEIADAVDSTLEAVKDKVNQGIATLQAKDIVSSLGHDGAGRDALGFVSRMGWNSGLYKHCYLNLNAFVQKAHADRVEIQKQRLALDLAQVQRDSRNTEPTGDIKHGWDGYAELHQAESAFSAKFKEFSTLIPPAEAETNKSERDVIIHDREALLAQHDGLSQTVASALGTSRGDIQAIEDKYLALALDVKRHGTITERKLWQINLAAQQAELEIKLEEYTSLIQRMSKWISKAEFMIARIKNLRTSEQSVAN